MKIRNDYSLINRVSNQGWPFGMTCLVSFWCEYDLENFKNVRNCLWLSSIIQVLAFWVSKTVWITVIQHFHCLLTVYEEWHAREKFNCMPLWRDSHGNNRFFFPGFAVHRNKESRWGTKIPYIQWDCRCLFYSHFGGLHEAVRQSAQT